ncbi:speckle-type POZ protein-like [Microplitis mediator]|uniref:speckle-type POZ protein-like n=1 Tax=Microplitis mediator TaxID=375433 RepID=UPI00255510DE|nr:speckle-type POZ protein-like [Microplitis mediator]
MERYNSKTVKHKLQYEWEIGDFTSLVDTPNFNVSCVEFESPKFSVKAGFENQWYLELNSSKERILIYLVSNTLKKNLRAQYTFSILNYKKEKKLVKLFNYFYNSPPCRGPEISIFKHELLNNKQEYLPNNTLTICVDLGVYDHYSLSVQIPSKSSKYSIADDLKKLLDVTVASDITLVVSNREFKSHKALLMVRSPVFYAMLSHDMKEKKENKITVPDIDPELFEKVFEFIYSDKVTDLDNFAEQLLEVADQYQLPGLVELCEESLGKSLTDYNAVRIMVLADRFNAKQLFDFAIDYVVSNITRIMTTSDYQEIVKSNPFISLKLIEKFATSGYGIGTS